MNDNDRLLIQQILQTAGEAGQQGFAYMVHYKFVDGVTDMIGSVICLIFCIWLMKWVWNTKKLDSSDGEDEAFWRALGTGVAGLGMLIFLWGTLAGIRNSLAPEGAAIHAMLHDIGASK